MSEKQPEITESILMDPEFIKWMKISDKIQGFSDEAEKTADAVNDIGEIDSISGIIHEQMPIPGTALGGVPSATLPNVPMAGSGQQQPNLTQEALKKWKQQNPKALDSLNPAIFKPLLDFWKFL